MKAEFYKVRGTEMEEMMKRGNNNEISSMISKKQQALAEALENVNDDAVVLFGTKESQFFGAFATQIYTNGDEVLITNQHTDATTPICCELLHEDIMFK